MIGCQRVPALFPPDVAFEVIAPGDTWENIQAKRRIYRQNGVVQVWVDAWEQQVDVISPQHGSRTFEAGQTAVVEELPGFQLNLFTVPRDSEK